MDFSQLSAEQLGNLLGVSGRRIRQLADEGRIPKPATPGRYDAPAAIRATIAEARASRPDSALETARARIAAVRAADLELNLEERRRRLVSVDVATDALDLALGVVVAELVGLPARVTRDPALRRKLEGEIDASRERMVKALAVATSAIRAGREPDDEAEDD